MPRDKELVMGKPTAAQLGAAIRKKAWDKFEPYKKFRGPDGGWWVVYDNPTDHTRSAVAEDITKAQAKLLLERLKAAWLEGYMLRNETE